MLISDEINILSNIYVDHINTAQFNGVDLNMLLFNTKIIDINEINERPIATSIIESEPKFNTSPTFTINVTIIKTPNNKFIIVFTAFVIIVLFKVNSDTVLECHLQKIPVFYLY